MLNNQEGMERTFWNAGESNGVKCKTCEKIKPEASGKLDLSVNPQFCIQNALKESLLETYERCLRWHRIHAIKRAWGLSSKLVGLLDKKICLSPDHQNLSKLLNFLSAVTLTSVQPMHKQRNTNFRSYSPDVPNHNHTDRNNSGRTGFLHAWWRRILFPTWLQVLTLFRLPEAWQRMQRRPNHKIWKCFHE